jgi:hypothetical protein
MIRPTSLRCLARLAVVALGSGAAALAPVAIVACSSGPGLPVDTIFGTPDLSGYVVGGAQQAVRTNEDLAVGNADGNVPGSTLRGLMSFNLATLPAGATVVSAKVYSRECAIVGHPIPGMGNILIEHVYYGQSADTSAFDTPALDTTGGVFTTDSTQGPRQRLQTSSVLADIAAGRGVSQFRLQMSEVENNYDTTSDYVAFQAPNGANNDICNPVTREGTQLIVTYRTGAAG